jgi:hypothetical protein
MEDGRDEERIDYDCLIGILQEILQRLEKVESHIKGDSDE